MFRRAFLVVIASAAVSINACKKTPPSNGPASAARCAFCGMKIKEDNAFRVKAKLQDGTDAAFDSPRCAFEAHVNPAKYKVASLSLQEFYDRTWHEPSELHYVIGSDVMGPMGHDLIPVLPAHEQKLMKDHKGKRIVVLSDINESMIEHLGESP